MGVQTFALPIFYHTFGHDALPGCQSVDNLDPAAGTDSRPDFGSPGNSIVTLDEDEAFVSLADNGEFGHRQRHARPGSDRDGPQHAGHQPPSGAGESGPAVTPPAGGAGPPP